MSEPYFDAAAGAWRTRDDDAWLDERSEDDAPDDAPEWTERVAPPPSPAKKDKPGEDPADREPDDPMDDPAFREASRGHRQLSGRVVSHGRRRGNHGTGRWGAGIRGLRVGTRGRIPGGEVGDMTVLADELGPVGGGIRPTGRQLGPGPPPTGKPSLSDAPELIARLLGRRRIALLRSSFTRRGRTTAQEHAARVYLAVILRALDATPANQAAADLLGADLRKIGDLRRRTYDPAAVATASQELAAYYRRR